MEIRTKRVSLNYVPIASRTQVIRIDARIPRKTETGAS